MISTWFAALAAVFSVANGDPRTDEAVAGSAPAHAHDMQSCPFYDRRHMDQLITVGTVRGGMTVGYTKTIASDWAASASFGQGSSRLGTDTRRTRIELGADHLPKENGLAGVYLGPRLSYAADTDLVVQATERTVTAAGMVGKRFIGRRGATFSIGGGLKYGMVLTQSAEAETRRARVDGKTIEVPEPRVSGLSLAAEAKVGWAF